MKTFIIRGSFTNPFELQNYSDLSQEYNLKVVSSLHPISTPTDIEVVKTWSPMDLPDFPLKRQILNRLYGDSQYLSGLNRILSGADLVHVAETYYGYSKQAAVLRSQGKIKKLISTVWETIPHNNEKLVGHRHNKRLVKRFTDHFICPTERAKSALVKEGIDIKKITVIPVGIDIDRFAPRTTQDKSKTYINILCVARFVPEKGILDLLSAFLAIKKDKPKIKLFLVGDGPLVSELRGYKDVHVKSVTYSQMPDVYQQADIFVLPSHKTDTWEEQYGMCLVEAMSSGLPVIGARSGAIPEVLAPGNLLFTAGDVDELQSRLRLLIDDEERRLKLGQQNRQFAQQHYDKHVVGKQISQLYRYVLSAS